LEDYDRLESDERQNKKESKVTQDTISLGGDSIINSPIKRVNQMLKEDSKLSNNKRGLLDEDIVAMLECQSFAIEDVLKKKKKHGKKLLNSSNSMVK